MSDTRATTGRPYGADGRPPRRGDSRIARRHARVSDKRAVEGAGPYGVDPRFPRRGDLRSPASLRACPTSGRGKPRPYDADGGFPVGAIHESPADPRACPTSGPGHGLGVSPYEVCARSPYHAL